MSSLNTVVQEFPESTILLYGEMKNKYESENSCDTYNNDICLFKLKSFYKNSHINIFNAGCMEYTIRKKSKQKKGCKLNTKYGMSRETCICEMVTDMTYLLLPRNCVCFPSTASINTVQKINPKENCTCSQFVRRSSCNIITSDMENQFNYDAYHSYFCNRRNTLSPYEILMTDLYKMSRARIDQEQSKKEQKEETVEKKAEKQETVQKNIQKKVTTEMKIQKKETTEKKLQNKSKVKSENTHKKNPEEKSQPNQRPNIKNIKENNSTTKAKVPLELVKEKITIVLNASHTDKNIANKYYEAIKANHKNTKTVNRRVQLNNRFCTAFLIFWLLIGLLWIGIKHCGRRGNCCRKCRKRERKDK